MTKEKETRDRLDELLTGQIGQWRDHWLDTLPPVIHNSGKKKVVGRHTVSTAMAPEDRWGTLVYKDAQGQTVTEKVPVGCAHYEMVYDNLIDAIENGAPKCIKDEEVIRVLEILEEATAVAKSHAE